MNDNDQLESATSRVKMLYTYEQDGKLTTKSFRGNYLSGFPKVNNSYYDDERDITYMIKPIYVFFLGKEVLRKDYSGRETVIIKTPFYKWLFMSPFPALFFMLAGGYILLVIDKKFREKYLMKIGRMTFSTADRRKRKQIPGNGYTED